MLTPCRGLPSFLHSLVMMVPCASQVKLTELSPAIRMPPVIVMAAPEILSVSSGKKGTEVNDYQVQIV